MRGAGANLIIIAPNTLTLTKTAAQIATVTDRLTALHFCKTAIQQNYATLDRRSLESSKSAVRVELRALKALQLQLKAR